MNSQDKIRILYIALFISVIGSIAGMFELSALKNIRFLTPILCLPVFLSKRTQSLHLQNVQHFGRTLLIIYLATTAYTFFSAELYFETGFTYRNIVNIVLIFTPVIVIMSVSKSCSTIEQGKIIDFMFFCFIGVFIIELSKKGISLSSIISILNANLITDSDYETESGVSLILGFYALHYLHENKKKHFITAILLTVLGAKRIAIFGLLICIILYFLHPAIKNSIARKKKTIVFLTTILGVGIAGAWHGIITGAYDQIVEDITGLSVNRFFMGRIGRFEIFLSHLYETPPPGAGYGFGYIENILYYAANYETSFHNDYYRMYLELGTIAFAIWLFVFIYNTIESKLAFTSTVLLFILMQTDNVFMYDRVMYSYLLVCTLGLKTNAIKKQN